MKQYEIIEMARQAGFTVGYGSPALPKHEAFAKLVAAKEREACEKRFMQLFLDPENQPTQFGTATQEYREQEIAEVSDLLFELASRIRTTHLYGPEVKKMLEQEEAIRARGEA